MSSNRRGIDLSIRSQLYALIFLFSFLLFGVILSTGISVWDHAGEDKEIEVVNHQRILLQKTADLFSNDAGEEIDLAGLIQSLEQNLSDLKDGGIGVGEVSSLFHLAAIRKARGDAAGARELLDRADSSAVPW